MSTDPIYSGLTELIERQRVELDQLRPLVAEYEKRRASDQSMIDDLHSEWLAERSTVLAELDTYKRDWQEARNEAGRLRVYLTEAYKASKQATEEIARLDAEVLKVRGWCRSIGLGHRPRIDGCELGVWLEFFKVEKQ